jgi:hypothetical protein
MKTDQKRWSYPTSLSIFKKKIIQTDRSQKKVLSVYAYKLIRHCYSIQGLQKFFHLNCMYR